MSLYIYLIYLHINQSQTPETYHSCLSQNFNQLFVVLRVWDVWQWDPVGLTYTKLHSNFCKDDLYNRYPFSTNIDINNSTLKFLFPGYNSSLYNSSKKKKPLYFSVSLFLTIFWSNRGNFKCKTHIKKVICKLIFWQIIYLIML